MRFFFNLYVVVTEEWDSPEDVSTGPVEGLNAFRAVKIMYFDHGRNMECSRILLICFLRLTGKRQLD